MKFSQFNSLVPYASNWALYNAELQKVVFIENQLEKLLRTALSDNIDNLQFLHPSFYRYLVEQNFIVDAATDEIGPIKARVDQIDGGQSDFFLMINPNMTCNFKCYYCYETHVTKSRMDANIAKRIKTFISKTANDSTIKTIRLSFFGGEPLLYFEKDVAPIIDWYVSSCRKHQIVPSVGFTTNGFLAGQEFIDFFKAKNMTCSLQITLDGFEEQHDAVRFSSGGRGSYKKIMQNIRRLIQNGFFVRVRINYTHKNIADAHLVARDLSDLDAFDKQHHALFDFHRVWQNYDGGDVGGLLSNTIREVESFGFKVSNSYAMNNVMESCYADKVNSAVINYNGDLFKCTARDFLNSKREGFITAEGDLSWEDGRLEKRMSSKFKNPPCLKCRILPICNGGCSQHAIERSDKGYCVFNGNDDEKDKVVLGKIADIMKAIEATPEAPAEAA